MPHLWMRHVTHMIESCHTYEYITACTRMRHVRSTNESWVTSHIGIRHVIHIYRRMSDITRSKMTHEHVYEMTHSRVSHDSWPIWKRVVCLMYTYNITLSHVWHDSWLIHVCVTRLIRTPRMTWSYPWHVCIFVTQLTMWHDSCL